MTETILKWGWNLALCEKTFTTFLGVLKIGVWFGPFWPICSTFFCRQGAPPVKYKHIWGISLQYIMVISWLYQGYIMVISRLYHGYILVISLLYLGYIMVISWLYHGYIMVISWLYLGYILVISWLYRGYILVISWLYHGFWRKDLQKWGFGHCFTCDS